MALSERRTTFQRCQDNQEKDCYSRAFSLVGLIDKERPLQPAEIKKFMKDCSPTKQLRVGSLVHLFNGEKEHIVVVIGLNPVTVSDRGGLGGEIRENLSLTDVMFEYGGLDIPIQYLQP